MASKLGSIDQLYWKMQATKQDHNCTTAKSTNYTYKVNMNGSAIHNQGRILGGGTLTEHQGKLVYAFSIALGFGTK